jgi:hypothetical protein
MKTQLNFLERFSNKISWLFQDRNGKDFPQSFVEGAVQNFIAGVDKLSDLSETAEYVVVTPQGVTENHAHHR